MLFIFTNMIDPGRVVAQPAPVPVLARFSTKIIFDYHHYIFIVTIIITLN